MKCGRYALDRRPRRHGGCIPIDSNSVCRDTKGMAVTICIVQPMARVPAARVAPPRYTGRRLPGLWLLLLMAGLALTARERCRACPDGVRRLRQCCATTAVRLLPLKHARSSVPAVQWLCAWHWRDTLLSSVPLAQVVERYR
jgi:hypothetical protein